MKIALYDLDRTLVSAPTFTPFLVFAARRIAPWRIAFLPVWAGMMLAYKLGIVTRKQLKQIGMRLMVGRPPQHDLEMIGSQFARRRIARSGWMPRVIDLVEHDRKAKAQLVIATAAFEFYARAFGDLLGIEQVIATRWAGDQIAGENCYGESKLVRVKAWMAERGFEREKVHLRFVSDSFADSPLLDYADEAIFVTRSHRKSCEARTRGWKVIDPGRTQASQ